MARLIAGVKTRHDLFAAITAHRPTGVGGRLHILFATLLPRDLDEEQKTASAPRGRTEQALDGLGLRIAKIVH